MDSVNVDRGRGITFAPPSLFNVTLHEISYNCLMKRLRVVDLDELAARWQIPVEVVKTFIVDYGMNPTHPEDWVPDHWDLWISEKQKAFEASVFPARFRITV